MLWVFTRLSVEHRKRNRGKRVNWELSSPAAVWEHVDFGEELIVKKRYPEEKWEIAWECECSWDKEGGLAFALLDGQREPMAGSAGDIF